MSEVNNHDSKVHIPTHIEVAWEHASLLSASLPCQPETNIPNFPQTRVARARSCEICSGGSALRSSVLAGSPVVLAAFFIGDMALGGGECARCDGAGVARGLPEPSPEPSPPLVLDGGTVATRAEVARRALRRAASVAEGMPATAAAYTPRNKAEVR